MPKPDRVAKTLEKIETARLRGEERIRKQIEAEDRAAHIALVNRVHNSIVAAKRRGEPTGELEATLARLINRP